MKGSTRKTGPVMLIRGANRKTHFYNRVSFSLGAVRGSEPENNSDLAEPLTGGQVAHGIILELDEIVWRIFSLVSNLIE